MSATSVGLLARSLVTGYYAHVAALLLSRDPRTQTWAPSAVESQAGTVRRNDGTVLSFDWRVNLDAARSDPALRDHLDRTWATSALITLGDVLDSEGYFDRAPILEMVRHLRNAVAHGNRFRIDKPEDLGPHPAHTRDAACRGQLGTTFEITPEINGVEALFEFVGPGDVVDILASVGTHLLPSPHPWHHRSRTEGAYGDSAAFRALPRKRIGAGLVILDDRGRVLLVKPTYKEAWEVPGGIVEIGESPRAAAQREAREELGIDVEVGRLLVIDWVPRGTLPDDGLMLLFAAEPIDESEIVLPPAELSEWRWCDLVTARSRVPDFMAHRLGAALRALRTGQALELENGMPAPLEFHVETRNSADRNQGFDV